MRIAKRKLAALLAVAIVCFLPKFASAYFYGSGDYSSDAGSCDGAGNYGGYFWCNGYYAWYYYEFSANAKNLSGNISIPADPVRSSTYVNSDGKTVRFDMPSAKVASVPAECAKNSSGFYLSGYAMMDDSTLSSPYTLDKLYNRALAHWPQYKGLYLALKSGASSNYVNATRVLSGAPLPTGISKISVVPYDTVKGVWENYAKAQAQKENKSTTFEDYTYFCAGDRVNVENYYDGDVLLKVNRDDGKGQNFGNNGDWQTAAYSNQSGKENTTAKVTMDGTGTKTLYYKSYGHAFQNNKGITADYERYNSSNFTLSTKAGTAAKQSSGAISGNPTTDSIGSHSYPSTYHSVQINPGETLTICAYNDYFAHYKTGTWSDLKSVSTCITVEYNNTAYNMGSVSQVVVRQNKVHKASAFDIDQNSKNKLQSLVDYGYGAANTQLAQSMDDPKTASVTSGITPGQIEVFALNKVTKISKTLNTAPDADIKLAGLSISNSISNADECNGKTLSATTNYLDCYNSGNSTLTIYPEETKTYSATTSVPSVIKASGDVSNDKVTTSASVTVTADPLYCKDFNNAQIGVNNAVNYGRIGFFDESFGILAGNMKDGSWKSTAEVYLSPASGGTMKNTKSSLRLTYSVCMGHQALLDSQSSKPIETVYSVSNDNAGERMKKFYEGTGNLLADSSTEGRNMSASEIGSDGLGRIRKGYAVTNQKTNNRIISDDFVGRTTRNCLSWDNGTNGDGTNACVDIKVPYNYYIDDKSVLVNNSDSIVYIGSAPTFEIKTKVQSRENNIVYNRDGSYATTPIKNTTRTITPLYISADIPTSTINSNSKILVDGAVTSNVLDVLSSRGLNVAQGKFAESEENGAITETFNRSDAIEDKTLTFEADDSRSIGDKLCVAVSVYPADSHNLVEVVNAMKDGSITSSLVKPKPINNDGQVAALSGPDYTEGASTLISLSCATVGKRPSTSVEGGSLMVNGAIEAGSTTYDGHSYGSWAEYDVVGSEGSDGFGSGASLAYLNPPSPTASIVDAIRISRVPGDGLESGKKKYPQSIGNTASETQYGSSAEAQSLIARGEDSTSEAWRFADNIYRNFIADSSASHPYLIKSTAPGGASVSGIFNGATQEGKIYIVHSSGKLLIDSNIENHLKSSIYVIYSEEGIDIAPGVTRIDAFLIANKNNTSTSSSSVVPTIDTCSGDGNEQGASSGNQNLIDNCNHTLLINGAVAAQKIKLDRAAGGGSFEGSEDLNPESLMQRAEVFNYDFRVVFWANSILEYDDVINPSHIKELNPRL